MIIIIKSKKEHYDKENKLYYSNKYYYDENNKLIKIN